MSCLQYHPGLTPNMTEKYENMRNRYMKIRNMKATFLTMFTTASVSISGGFFWIFEYLNIFRVYLNIFLYLWKYSVTLNIRLSLGRVFRGLAMANFNYCGKNLNLISSEFHIMWNFEFQIWKKPLGRLFSRAYVWAVFPEAMIFARSARFAWILWNSPEIKYFIHQQK